MKKTTATNIEYYEPRSYLEPSKKPSQQRETIQMVSMKTPEYYEVISDQRSIDCKSMSEPDYLEPFKQIPQQDEPKRLVEDYEVISDQRSIDCKSMSEPDYLVPFKQLPQQDEPVRLVEDYEVITDCKLRYSCKLINECRVCEKQNVYEVFFSFYF